MGLPGQLVRKGLITSFNTTTRGMITLLWDDKVGKLREVIGSQLPQNDNAISTWHTEQHVTLNQWPWPCIPPLNHAWPYSVRYVWETL